MKTPKVKRVLSYLPEILILLTAVYWFADNLSAPSSRINYLMIGIILFISGLLILKNKTMALFLSLALGVGSIYMLLAVLSEYKEFPAGSPEGLKLLLIGTLLFSIILLSAVFLPIKYFRNNKET